MPKVPVIEHFYFSETPIEKCKYLSEKFGANIFIKRDDLFPSAGSGNKARKLQYIMYKIKKEGYNSIVTAGGLNSNHNRATAIMAAKLGIKCKLIVHTDTPELAHTSLNLKIAKLCGAEIELCSMKDVAIVMDNAIIEFSNKDYKPFYLWGGGHCLEGSFSFFDAMKNLHSISKLDFSHFFFASGTGTTHAGIHVGASFFYPNSNVIGISISRNKDRGIYEIEKSIKELENYIGFSSLSQNEIIFKDEFLFGGYEKKSNEIDATINMLAKNEGIILDPTYTGKAFYGMTQFLRNNSIHPNSNILFWHTGGVYNLLSNNFSI